MSEDQQIEKFDPSTLMRGVKDRIKMRFAENAMLNLRNDIQNHRF